MDRTTSMYGLLDLAAPQAIAMLKDQGVGPLARAVLQIKVRWNDKVRDQIVAELAMKLAADEEFAKLCPDCVSLMAEEGYMLSKPFKIAAIDIEKAIELLLKYLPLILALFAK